MTKHADTLVSILENKESAAEPHVYIDKAEVAARRKATIRRVAGMRSDMDEAAREMLNVSNRWGYLKCISAIEDHIEDRYRLSREEIDLIKDDIEDLIDAGVVGEDYNHQNTAFIILRVVFNDDWRLFLEGMRHKLDLDWK